MKPKQYNPTHPIWILVVVFVFFACGKSNNASETVDVGGTSITSNDEAIQNIPSPDPSSMDYSLVSGDTSLSPRGVLKQEGPPGAEEVGCLIDTLYTVGTQFARRIERIFLCKARGAFVLASQGEASVSLGQDGEVYLQFDSLDDEGNGDGEDETSEAIGSAAARQADEGSGMIAKIKHTVGTGLGTFQLYLCNDDRQIGYATFEISDDTYSGRAILRREEGECAEAVYDRNLAAITSDDFQGNVTLNFDHETERGILALSASGETESNTLQGRRQADDGDGMALGYWEATQGCGMAGHETETTGEVPFSISVASDGTKTYSDFSGDGDELCANLPSEPVLGDCPEFADVTGAEWDCDVTGKTVVEFSSASGLEDAGGERCREMQDAFENAEPNPDSCF